MKYRQGDKERLLAFGIYPHVTLAQAREKRDAAKALLAQGIDPSAHQKEVAAAKKRMDEGTFDRAAEAWLAFKSAEWSDESRRKAEYVTHTYLIPALGKFSMATLSGQDVAPVLRKMAVQTPDLARKARQYMKAIALFAMREGLRDEGRMLMLDGALPRAANRSHIPAATLPEEAAEVMRAVSSHSVDVTRAALLLCAYTAQRPGVVAAMCWDEVVLKAGEWRIPAAKMKTRHAHIVPLPRQAVALLRDMAVYTKGREYVFPPLARQKTPHLHRDSLSRALRSLGLEDKHATHGFRAMLRTLGRERLGIAPISWKPSWHMPSGGRFRPPMTAPLSPKPGATPCRNGPTGWTNLPKGPKWYRCGMQQLTDSFLSGRY